MQMATEIRLAFVDFEGHPGVTKGAVIGLWIEVLLLTRGL
jgi:hypothetical protein